MASLDVIRTLTLRAKTEGVQQSADELKKLSGAQEQVAESSVKQERATLSLDKAVQNLQRRYDQEFRAAQEVARVQKTLEQARAQGLITIDRQAQLMRLAIQQHNTSSAAININKVALQQLGAEAASLTSGLGAVGGLLAGLGPIGLAVGAALGAVAVAFTAASHAALDFADKAGKLIDLSETIGLTTRQLQGLQIAGENVGISIDKIEALMSRFAATLGQVRDGEGDAAKKLNELDPALLRSVQSAQTIAEAYDVLAKALTKLDPAKAAEINKAFFGREGVAAIRLENLTDAAGGIDKLTNSFNQLDIVSKQQLKTLDDLGDAFNQNMRLIKQSIILAFAEDVLQALKTFSDLLKKLRDDIVNFGGSVATQNFLGNFIDQRVIQGMVEYISLWKSLGDTILAVVNILRTFPNVFGADAVAAANELKSAWENTASSAKNLFNIMSDLNTESKNGVSGMDKASDGFKKTGSAADDAAPKLGKFNLGLKDTGKSGKEARDALDILRDNVTALGAAATTTERYQLAVAELAKKLQEGTISQDTFNRAVSQLNPTVVALKDVVTNVGDALAKAFIQGKSAAEALNSALKAVASTAASSAIKSLTTGLTGGGFDITGIATSGIVAVGASFLSRLFGGGDSKSQAAVQAAQQAQAQALASITQNLAAASEALADTATRQGAVLALQSRQQAELQEAFQQTRSGLIDTATANALIASLQTKHNAEMVALQRKFDAQELQQRRAALDTLNSALGRGSTQFQASLQKVVEAFQAAGPDIDKFGDVVGLVREFALVSLGLQKPLSDVQQAINAVIQNTASLEQALKELGVAEQDAAKIARDDLAAALEGLRKSFSDDLISKINSLAGADWINQITDLVTTVNQLRADAAALGNINPRLIEDFFVLSAQQIIDQNELTGNSFLALVNATGLANAGLHEFVAEVENAGGAIKRTAAEIASAIQDFQDQLFVAQQNQETLAGQLAVFDLNALRQREQEIARGGEALAALEALQAQLRLNIIRDFNKKIQEEEERARQAALDAAQRAAEQQQRILDEARQFLESQIRRIQDFITHFLSGPTSTLSPQQQLATAQSAFTAQYALALGGNRDALSGITTNAQDLIDAARRYYGSGTAGQNIITQMIQQLQALPSLVSPEQFIVNAIEASTVDITTTVIDANQDLIDALASGDLSAFAVALDAHFTELDTNLDGLLSFDEFTQGLHGMANDGLLRDMFTRLDTDNSGSLSRLEVIAAGTNLLPPIKTDTGKLPDIETNTGNAADLALQQVTQLTALAQISNNTNSIANFTSQSVGVQSNILSELGTQTGILLRLIAGQNAQNANWGAPGPINIGTFAKGGYVTGPGTGTSDSIIARLSAGEGIITAQRMREMGGRQAITRINAGMPLIASNDNNRIVEAIMQLETTFISAVRAIIAAEFAAAGMISRPLEEANKVTKRRRAAA